MPCILRRWLTVLLVATCLAGSALCSSAGERSGSLDTAASHQPQDGTDNVVPLVPYGRHTDDLDGMVKRRNLRALVLINPIGFFYVNGQPKGISYEALTDFETFVNQKLRTGSVPVEVTFLPLRPDQLQAALIDGTGDFIADGLVVSPERQKVVAFTTPIETNVRQVVVTGPSCGDVSTLADLGGKEVYVNPLTVTYANLQQVNQTLQQAGKPLIKIRTSDTNLTDDDLIQMVNGGMLPATVTTLERAKLWEQVLPHLKVHSNMVVASGEQLAWAVRKNNPQLLQLLNQFIAPRAVGTSFGDTLLHRYLQESDWVKNATSPEEIKKFEALIAYFQKYADEYDFDYLMLAAQGYQESMLQQSKRSPGGAVGIMQVIPRYAAAPPISVPNVDTADGNIHAGVKMLRSIEDQYLNDPKIDRLNKTLLAFASYNAGANRIARLRQQAKEQGLDPNQWFDNVELMVARNIGQVTVIYVGNVYKYYVAYKLALQQQQEQQKDKQAGK